MKTNASRPKISLTSRLLLLVATIFVSFAMFFIFFQYQREKKYRIDILNTRLQSCNEDVRDLILTDTAALTRYEARLLNDGIRVTVLDTSGNVLSDSQASDLSRLNFRMLQMSTSSSTTRIFFLSSIISVVAAKIVSSCYNNVISLTFLS